jgi:hypothetical protein
MSDKPNLILKGKKAWLFVGVHVPRKRNPRNGQGLAGDIGGGR